ncbi:MAG: hypothetical protein M1816_003562 [Peltula sp. TS41687]|nr:MAG: hypothetical protein M1816_003562 [Peltula sp. TS41687]
MALTTLIILVAASLLVWEICGVIYHLYLSPLAKFPGPKLAASSRFYEFYYDCLLKGKFAFKISELHKRYGPIVRISPYEVHIDDPDYFDQIYSVTSRLDKYSWFYDCFNLPAAGLLAKSHEVHHRRRKPLAYLFTNSCVARLEPGLRQVVKNLLMKFQKHKDSKTPLDLSSLYRCFTIDVVTEYCFPRGYGFLDTPDYSKDFFFTLRKFNQTSAWNRYIPLIQLQALMPLRLLRLLDPKIPEVMTFVEVGLDTETVASINTDLRVKSFGIQAKEVLDDKEFNSKKREYAAVLHELRDSDDPEMFDEKSRLKRMTDEAQTIVSAGMETTGNTLSTITYHLLQNPDMVRRLKEELDSVGQDRTEIVPYQVLRELPYLTALISEGLRITCNVSARSPRVNPNSPMQYRDWTIPAGTAVSMSIIDIHMNENIFTEPKVFRPDRWLGDETTKRQLERYLVPFSRGSRNCLGMNLAYAEIYLALGNIFRLYDMSLYETDPSDLEIAHDFFASYPKEDSNGVRVKVL